jgi:hypothetical protein
MLADAAGEHQPVESTEHGGQGTDLLARAGNEHRHCQRRVVVCLLRIEQVAHVTGDSGNADHAGLLVQQPVHPVSVEVFQAHDR